MQRFQLRDQSPLVLILWGALLLTIVVALGFGRWSLAFVALVTLSLAIAPAMLAQRLDITLPVPFVFAVTIFIIASVFMGEAFDFYERVWWWDIALHGASAVGFGLIGFLFILMLFEGDRYAAPPAALALIAFACGVTFGAVWEIFEFLMDLSFGLNMQKSGLVDTMGDLIVDTIGSAMGGFAGYLYLRGSSAGILPRALQQFVNLNRRLYQKSKQRLRSQRPPPDS